MSEQIDLKQWLNGIKASVMTDGDWDPDNDEKSLNRIFAIIDSVAPLNDSGITTHICKFLEGASKYGSPIRVGEDGLEFNVTILKTDDYEALTKRIEILEDEAKVSGAELGRGRPCRTDHV